MSTPILRAKITGQGKSVPDKILTNHDLEKMVDTSDEWITTRTGIQERRILEEGKSTSDMCRDAALQALEQAGMDPAELDMIIVGTCTPDEILPSCACRVQALIGAKNAMAFDLNAACTGYLYGITLANAMIVSGQIKKTLVIGADTLSRIVNWEDRATCVLFGDGAGASVLEASADDTGIIGSFNQADGTYGDILYIPDGGARNPITHESLDEHRNHLHMRGNEVFKIAVKSMEKASRKVLKTAGMDVSDIDIAIPHQANIRIVKALGERLGIEEEKVYVTVHKYGNTSASSIPIAMMDAMNEGKIKTGTTGLFMAFGSGLTWGASLIRF